MSDLKQAWEYSFIHSSATGRGDEEVGPCLTYDKKQAFGVGCIKQREVFIGTQPEATAPAQDLSAAILALPLPTPKFKDVVRGGVMFEDSYSQEQMRELLKSAAALASSANALSAEIPDGCARGWNGTIYQGIAEIYHRMEEGEALHMTLDDKGVPRADKDGCVYSLVGRIEQYVALSAGDRVDAITDTQRIDHIEACSTSNKARGMHWNTFCFDVGSTVREQLDAAILQSQKAK